MRCVKCGGMVRLREHGIYAEGVRHGGLVIL